MMISIVMAFAADENNSASVQQVHDSGIFITYEEMQQGVGLCAIQMPDNTIILAKDSAIQTRAVGDVLFKLRLYTTGETLGRLTWTAY